MINNFWFYFFLTPVVVGTIILSIPSFYHSSINPPVFEEAVSTCKNISNEDVYATEYGTLQDKCIANYMGEPRNWEYFFIIIGNVGIFFTLPLIIYVLFNITKIHKFND